MRPTICDFVVFDLVDGQQQALLLRHHSLQRSFVICIDDHYLNGANRNSPGTASFAVTKTFRARGATDCFSQCATTGG